MISLSGFGVESGLAVRGHGVRFIAAVIGGALLLVGLHLIAAAIIVPVLARHAD